MDPLNFNLGNYFLNTEADEGPFKRKKVCNEKLNNNPNNHYEFGCYNSDATTESVEYSEHFNELCGSYSRGVSLNDEIEMAKSIEQALQKPKPSYDETVNKIVKNMPALCKGSIESELTAQFKELKIKGVKRKRSANLKILAAAAQFHGKKELVLIPLITPEPANRKANISFLCNKNSSSSRENSANTETIEDSIKQALAMDDYQDAAKTAGINDVKVKNEVRIFRPFETKAICSEKQPIEINSLSNWEKTRDQRGSETFISCFQQRDPKSRRINENSESSKILAKKILNENNPLKKIVSEKKDSFQRHIWTKDDFELVKQTVLENSSELQYLTKTETAEKILKIINTPEERLPVSTPALLNQFRLRNLRDFFKENNFFPK